MLTPGGACGQEPSGALGGLLERAGMRAAVTTALRSAPIGGIAVAVVGLDRFSGVNGALGRAAGDEALEQVALRLASAGTALARLGGDEFAVLAVGAAAGAVGEQIAAALRAPLDVNGRSVFLGASVGVACGPIDGCDASTLLQHADTAMQIAKERGGGLVLRYAGSLRSDAEHRLAIASGLQLALEHDELVLHYQPIVQASSRRIVGVEALVRWRHPELGLVPPDEFIPVAEDTGLIVPLGEWVLDEACRQASRWQQIQPLRLAVNLSARQLEHQRFDHVVARTLHRHGLDPRLLELELTERSILHDHDEVAATLGELQALGVSCSVDDFGTGYGGLSYLIDFPVSELKIDRSFVREIDAGGTHAAITSALIRLARDLQLRVVAEGVETETQARFLEQEGCDELQGYLLSRPLPADAIGDVLRAAPSSSLPREAVPASVSLPVTSSATRPAPVRPGPRRTRRRLAPVLAVAAVGCALTAGAPAGALPAFGQRTIAAVAAVADVVSAGVHHVGEIVVPDPEPAEPGPGAVAGEPSPSTLVTVAAPPANAEHEPVTPSFDDATATSPEAGQARRPVAGNEGRRPSPVTPTTSPASARDDLPAKDDRGQGHDTSPAMPATPPTGAGGGSSNGSGTANGGTPDGRANGGNGGGNGGDAGIANGNGSAGNGNAGNAGGDVGNGNAGANNGSSANGNAGGSANGNPGDANGSSDGNAENAAGGNGSANGNGGGGNAAAADHGTQGATVTGEDPPGQRGVH